MHRIFKALKNTPSAYVRIFTAVFFYAFHYFFITFVNSSFLQTYLSDSEVGYLYALGSLISITLLLSLEKITEKTGLYGTMLILAFLETFALMGLGTASNVWIIIGSFILHTSLPFVLLACLDTFLEESTEEARMGKIRGIFLTITAVASIISPLVIGQIVADGGFQVVYVFSAFFMTLFMLILWMSRFDMRNISFPKIGGFQAVREFLSTPDIRRIGGASVILQLFYSWMIIYVPLYLLETGFSWPEIGVMISISLLPFLFTEIPLGEIADKKLGEKEMLIGGMVITATSLLALPLIQGPRIVLFTIVIFMARLGASIMETMIESYFFKKSKGRDELISVFRMSHPLAFILGPLLGSIGLFFFPFRYIFPLLSCLLFIGIIFALRLKDTK